MNSLFERGKDNNSMLLTLPTYCAPTHESEDLVSKREAALRWMQENGVKYLGSPAERLRTPQSSQVSVTSMNVVSVHDHEDPDVDDFSDRAQSA